VYVNLGAGRNTSGEFINIDTRPLPHTHHIHGVEELPMFNDESVDLLYASHLLEHVEREKLDKTLEEWHRVLKYGGILRFGVPDFDSLIEVYRLSGNNVESVVNQIMGAGAPYDDHHTIWNFDYAEAVLKRVGFREVRRWTPETVDHHDFIDKTMRTVHISGREIPISLNVEAVK
jgi:predicted SAM-dependent methyltransferase